MLVGAPLADNNERIESGSAYVVLGKASTDGIDLAFSTSVRLQLDGADTGERAGWSVAGAGDVNGDRRPDFVVGAPWANANGRFFSGSAYVVFGQAAADDDRPRHAWYIRLPDRRADRRRHRVRRRRLVRLRGRRCQRRRPRGRGRRLPVLQRRAARGLGSSLRRVRQGDVHARRSRLTRQQRVQDRRCEGRRSRRRVGREPRRRELRRPRRSARRRRTGRQQRAQGLGIRLRRVRKEGRSRGRPSCSR